MPETTITKTEKTYNTTALNDLPGEPTESFKTPAYYAVIPADVRYDKHLIPNAKLLYGEITALCNKEGYCWAENSYFAKLYDCTEKSISVWLSQLREYGHIIIEISRSKSQRRISLADAQLRKKTLSGKHENVIRWLRKGKQVDEKNMPQTQHPSAFSPDEISLNITSNTSINTDQTKASGPGMILVDEPNEPKTKDQKLFIGGKPKERKTEDAATFKSNKSNKSKDIDSRIAPKYHSNPIFNHFLCQTGQTSLRDPNGPEIQLLLRIKQDFVPVDIACEAMSSAIEKFEASKAAGTRNHWEKISRFTYFEIPIYQAFEQYTSGILVSNDCDTQLQAGIATFRHLLEVDDNTLQTSLDSDYVRMIDAQGSQGSQGSNGKNGKNGKVDLGNLIITDKGLKFVKEYLCP